jgi:phosphatidylserine decarboxylase
MPLSGKGGAPVAREGGQRFGPPHLGDVPGPRLTRSVASRRTHRFPMRIDRAGLPFITAALVPAALSALAKRRAWAALFALLGGYLAYFFRDPDRQVPKGRGLVVAPADGRVMICGPTDQRWAPPGSWKQVTIFLSPLDVHINRAPVEGRVTRIEFRPGKFLPAFDERSSDNELNEIWIDHAGQPIVVRQVVGILARRIVCRVHQGELLERGQRIGLMKFGSRMDVFVPMSADLRVKVGQRVIAAETVLATLPAAEPARTTAATASMASKAPRRSTSP